MKDVQFRHKYSGPRVVGPASVLGRTLTYSIVCRFDFFFINTFICNVGRTLACQLRRSTNHADHVPTLDQRLVADWVITRTNINLILELCKLITGKLYHLRLANIGPTISTQRLGCSRWPNVGRPLACQLRRSTNHADHVPTSQRWDLTIDQPSATCRRPGVGSWSHINLLHSMSI
jgi:hypothetical protein